MCDKHLEFVFRHFDKDNSGQISASELKDMFGQDYIQEEVWDELINEVDLDGNGEIDLAEFRELLSKVN